MNNINKRTTNKIIESIILCIFGAGVIIMAIYLILSEMVAEKLLLIIFMLFIGITFFVLSFIQLFKTLFRKSDMNKVMKNYNIIMAHIDGKKSYNYEGSVITCSALINGNKYEFYSDPIKFDLLYAAKELGIEEIKVFIEANNINKYIVNTEEIENRIVDLT